MSTSPIKIIRTVVTLDELLAADIARHRRRDTLEQRLNRAAALLMWVAACIAIAAAIVGTVHPWVQIVVVVMLLVGAAALAVLNYQTASRRLDAVISRLLGR